MDENCEEKLRSFNYQEMDSIHHIEFGNVHRFGKRPSGENDSPQPIVARFIIKMKNSFKFRRIKSW
jgi:hypothetical protein